MKKLAIIGILLSGAITTSAAYAQLGFQDNLNTDWSPYDTVHCLGIECGRDMMTDRQLLDSIDFFDLDYLARTSLDPFGYLNNWHHRSPEEIQLCTSVCYSHYKESEKACRAAAPNDGTLYGNLSGAPDEVALQTCLSSVRDTLFQCIPSCNAH